MIQTDQNYQNETGLSPEAEVTLMLQTLENTDQVINDYSGQGKATRCFTSMFASGLVPGAYWHRDRRRARLNGGSSDYRDVYYGSRSSVRV